MEASNLSKIWQNFFAKFSHIDLIPVHLWKEVHLLGYFDRLYYNFYQRKFAYSLQGQPSKCPEIVFIKKILAGLDGKSETAKEYMNWFFQEKVKPNNLKIRTLSYLMKPVILNEFLEQKQKEDIITQSTTLPEKFKPIINQFTFSMETYGDLAFAYLSSQNYSEDTKSVYDSFFSELKNLGLEEKTLKSLIE